MLGKIVGKRRRGQQRMRRLVGIIKSMDMSLSKLWELVMDRKPGVLRFMGSQRVGHDWTTEEQQQWIVRGLPWGSAVDKGLCVPSLCWEDPMEEGKATHSSILV